MVFTDGAETNHFPKISDITPVVLEKEAIVHGLLLAGVADDHDLIELALETGGTFCVYVVGRTEGEADYYDCLIAIAEGIGTITPLSVRKN